MQKARTLGELRKSDYRRVSVKDELRANLICKLAAGKPVFPGIIGFDDTVIPQIANAVLSRHNSILLGLRGQAKSRILRALVSLLDEEFPFIAGCVRSTTIPFSLFAALATNGSASVATPPPLITCRASSAS